MITPGSTPGTIEPETQRPDEAFMEQPEPVERPLRPGVVSCVIRPGAPELAADDWTDLTAEQRIDAVWTLTKACMAWNSEGDDEPRLQRSVVHIQRAGG